MKTSTKIIIGVAAMAATGMIIYATRLRKTRRMLNQVSDEGYEIAHDVLFPQKDIWGAKLHYGPVIPL